MHFSICSGAVPGALSPRGHSGEIFSLIVLDMFHAPLHNSRPKTSNLPEVMCLARIPLHCTSSWHRVQERPGKTSPLVGQLQIDGNLEVSRKC